MSATSLFLIILATLPALGLAIWASMAMDRMDQDSPEFTDPEDLRLDASTTRLFPINTTQGLT